MYKLKLITQEFYNCLSQINSIRNDCAHYSYSLEKIRTEYLVKIKKYYNNYCNKDDMKIFKTKQIFIESRRYRVVILEVIMQFDKLLSNLSEIKEHKHVICFEKKSTK